jgi:hypothetical protein
MIDTPLKKLTYRKTPTVKNIDDLIKKKCDGLREGYMQALETHNANLNEFAKKINTITYSIADNRGILKARMDRLEQIDGDAKVEVGTDSQKDDFAFFSKW